MKTALYVAVVSRTYRQAVDDYLKDPKVYEKNIPHYKDEISRCTYRQFTTGFFFGPTSHETQIYDSNTYVSEYTYLGTVEDVKDGRALFSQRNKFSVGESLEVMKPSGENIVVTVKALYDEDMKPVESCPHPKQKIWLEADADFSQYDILRRKEIAESKNGEAN